MTINLVRILPANNGACVRAEKRVWDVCMCRLIVRTAIESTYVGVLVTNNGCLDMSQCVYGLSQYSTLIMFC